MLEQLRAHHWYQRQGNDGGNQYGYRQGDCELAKQASHDVLHEQQRNEHGDQRYRQRNDGETDLPGALQRGFERRIARLNVT